MKHKFLILAIAIAPVLSAQNNAAKLAPAADSATPAISKELGEAILNELRQIRTLLESRQPPAALAAPAAEKAKISMRGFAIGSADAPLTLVEFADYQCPFCRQFHSTAYERLKKEFIDKGTLRFVSRDLPLDMHSNAMRAANASRCAGDQQKFWQLRAALISHADKLDPEAIASYASVLRLDMAQFQSCVASEKYVPSIRADIAEATAVGIGGTPSFVLGKATPDGVEGIKLMGAQPYEAFERAIKEELAK